MKIKREKIAIFAIVAGIWILAGGKASAAEVYRIEENVEYGADGKDSAEEEIANYERFKNMEKTSVAMGFLRNENLQQKTRILLLVSLAVTVLLFVSTKVMIYKKEKEKEDRK